MIKEVLIALKAVCQILTWDWILAMVLENQILDQVSIKGSKSSEFHIYDFVIWYLLKSSIR